jgi:hypothetical protein
MTTGEVSKAAEQGQSIPADICSQIVEASARFCHPTAGMPPQPLNPNWDAMAASFASLSNAFAWGSIVLAVVAIVAALAWGKLVTASAEREAKEMAKRCAKEYIQDWMADNAPGIIRSQVDLLNDATIGEGNDARAADEIGKEA